MGVSNLTLASSSMRTLNTGNMLTLLALEWYSIYLKNVHDSDLNLPVGLVP